MLLLVTSYDNKMVKLPGWPYIRSSPCNKPTKKITVHTSCYWVLDLLCYVVGNHCNKPSSLKSQNSFFLLFNASWSFHHKKISQANLLIVIYCDTSGIICFKKCNKNERETSNKRKGMANSADISPTDVERWSVEYPLVGKSLDIGRSVALKN